MKFSKAMEALEQGRKITRPSFGKNDFLVAEAHAEYPGVWFYRDGVRERVVEIEGLFFVDDFMVVPERAVIVDIDGTIADCTHRLHYIQNQPKDWDSFYEACSDDKPIPDVLELCRHLHERYLLLFVTGRKAKVRFKTRDWLEEYFNLDRCELFMRGEMDRREDWIVKKEIYEQCIAPFYSVQFVLEDRQQCVDMWRKLGLTCLQCDKGDF